MTEELSGSIFTYWHQPPGVKTHPITIHEAVCAMQPWSHHPHWFIYHCQAVWGCGWFKCHSVPQRLFFMYVVIIARRTKECVLTLAHVVHIKEGARIGMDWQLVCGGEDWSLARSRPVCGPLWVLKLCTGAFYRVPLDRKLSALVSETQGN